LTRSAVLIVTNERDVGADFLVRELDSRGVRVVRLNSERAPEWKLSLEPTAGWRIARGARTLASEECVGVWWRRPETPPLTVDVGAAAEAVSEQWRAFLMALATIAGPVWVSDPSRIRSAENKALQLRMARDSGLAVPSSIWTNDVDAARSFIDACDGVAVVKSITSAWWEEPEGASFVYASLIVPEDLPSAARLAQAPVGFQQPIVSKRDVRVTVVEDVVLGAIREPPSEDAQEPIDWRHAPQRPWLRYELPANLVGECRDLVLAAGLRFGALDFALDQHGKHWFLELNPNGEWGWLQRIGLPIAEALADTLTADGTGR
jgi:hypothetical protein